MEKQSQQQSLIDALTRINVLARKMTEMYKCYEEARNEYLQALNELEID
jgi:hypothetical protein